MRGVVEFDESENAATVIAANALRRHQDYSCGNLLFAAMPANVNLRAVRISRGNKFVGVEIFVALVAKQEVVFNAM